MKTWIIISWDVVSGKGTALGKVNGTYEEAVKYAKEEYGTWENLTLSGVIE